MMEPKYSIHKGVCKDGINMGYYVRDRINKKILFEGREIKEVAKYFRSIKMKDIKNIIIVPLSFEERKALETLLSSK